MDQAKYDEINRTLREIAEDLEMPVETLRRVYCAPPSGGRLYVGGGEDAAPYPLRMENSAYGAFLRGEQ